MRTIYNYTSKLKSSEMVGGCGEGGSERRDGARDRAPISIWSYICEHVFPMAYELSFSGSKLSILLTRHPASELPVLLYFYLINEEIYI